MHACNFNLYYKKYYLISIQVEIPGMEGDIIIELLQLD